ncbi:transglutaminase domain-containing protein [Haliangium ochraceum]|uniref:transglutaminase domain-containing protein n=1 Tax=Haliangium ochraceum TaxID=80816 RepID=UPI00030B2EF7|nr:transglutaminase domain-containing protein [Haliangium ochraceum]
MLSQVLGGTAVFALALTAVAQVGSRILHRDLPPPERPAEADFDDSQPLFGPDPGDGQNPSAFAYRSKILPAPQTGPEPEEDEPVHGRRGFAVDRVTQTKPDQVTNADDTLQYVTVFNPSVLPFKRMSALDSVRGDYVLFTADDDALRDLPVGGSPSPERDLFWGDIAMELAGGQAIAIPSVAPDMRILSYEVEPATSLVFSKDGADNYFVRSGDKNAEGTFRLRFMVDAAASYFAPPMPRGMSVREAAEKAPPGLLKPLPDKLRGNLRRALQRLDIDEDMPLRRALNVLVAHFREFEAGYLSQNARDIYLDLVFQQMGVCRHRAFAFTVTANGLGIPTRYVTNEAHAWVEVWLPESEWVRIDLGGAALRMTVDNASDKSIYQPRGEDPFAKPSKYRDNYTQLEGDITGLSGEQLAEGRQMGPTVRDPGDTFNPGPAQPDTSPRDLLISPGTELPEVPAAVVENKERSRLRINYVDPEGFLGEAVTVSGQLSSGGKGIGGQRVDIYLAPAGQGGNGARFVDRTVTEPSGDFTVVLQIPGELELQAYEVYASTPGDSRFAPALSE